MSERKDSLRTVETAVLDTYRKENPSTYHVDRSNEAFAARGRQRERLFRDLLHFPPKMFEGSRVLDLGAGTGENTIYYARWGARCTLVEINDQALARANHIFSTFAGETAAHRFVRSSLFDYDEDVQYDIAISNAVLHCTADKERGFRHLCRFARPGGWVMLGIASKAGNAQRMLQRLAVYAFAATEEQMVEVAEALFADHITRAEAVGGRTRRAIIYDTYVNPKWDQPSVAEVLGWFRENGLDFYSAWPPVTMPWLGDSGMRATFDHRKFPAIGALAELAWFAHDVDDAVEVPELLRSLESLAAAQDRVMTALNDFQPGQRLNANAFAHDLDEYRRAVRSCDPVAALRTKLEALLDEIERLIALVEGGDRDAVAAHIRSCRHLFQGTAGLGMNFYIGHKPDSAAG